MNLPSVVWLVAGRPVGGPLERPRDYNFKLPDKGGGRERDHKKSFCPSFVIAKREEPLAAAAEGRGGESLFPSPQLRSLVVH